MKNIILIITAICANAFICIAQKQNPPAGSTAKDFKLSAKKIQTYSNGLKSTLVHYGNLPKVNISLIIKTGNIHEAADQVWLADLTVNMLKEGTSTMKFSDFAKKAAGMGGNINVGVGVAQTTISGSVLSEYAADFIQLISELVMNPAFPVSELERLKSDQKRQLTIQKAGPQAQAQEKFFGAVYKDQPYGRYFPTEAMLNSYAIDAVKEFYNNNFGAKRSVLYVVGKFDDASVNKAINNSLTKWKSGPGVTYPKVTATPVSDTMMIERKGAPQTTLMVGLPVTTPDNKDYVPLLITNSLLGGSFGSRITSNIRENKGYTYSPSSSVSNRKGSSLWFEQADVTTEHTIASLIEIEKEIKKLQDVEPGEDELQGIKNYEAGIFVLQNSTPGGIIGQLNFLDLYGLDDSYLNNYVKNIHSITPKKVQEIAKKYIQYDKMTKVLVGDTEKIKQQINTQKKELKAF